MDANGEPVPIDELIKTANTMSSIMMAHKIALEDDFKLEPGMDISGPLMSLSPIIGSSPSKSSSGQKTEPSLKTKVKDIVHEAYWDVFKEELESSGNPTDRKYDVSKQLLQDIKQKMLELLLPQHSRFKADIEDRMDAKIIEQLCQIHSLDLLDYSRYILNVLSKLCAPVRDEKIEELQKIDDITQVYRGIMDLLELMRLDYANFTLNRFKPHIKAHSQDYERYKFNEMQRLQKSIGIDGLEYTKQWLARAMNKVNESHGIDEILNEATNADALDPSSSDSGVAIRDKVIRAGLVNKILNAAYIELLEWSYETQKSYPETLVFDEATFKQLSEQYRILVITASILLTTFAFVSKLRIQESDEFKFLIKSNVITLLTANYDAQTSSPSETLEQVMLDTIATRVAEDFRQKLQSTAPDMLKDFEAQSDILKRQINDLANSSNRVRSLARRRTLEFVDTLLTIDVEHQQKKFSSKMAPPVNIPLGLNCLSEELTLVMAQLVKIIRYNRTVHYQHYETIIVDCVSKLLK